jgi:glycosyltransferase involved in cell wall biosynthesis
MRLAMKPPDVGIFFGRPVRSHFLAEELRTRGSSVVVYNNRGLPGTYVQVPMAFLPALAYLFSTHHQIYHTSFCFVPALCLYLNRVIRGIPYVFNAVGLMSATYRDRARRLPFSQQAEDWFYPTLMKRVIAKASFVVCNSYYLQKRIEHEFPEYAHRMMTIHNGVEFDRFASGRPMAIDGIPSGAINLISVMTWDYAGKSSGARLLIDAMEFIIKGFPAARLTIAAKLGHQGYARVIQDYLVTKPWASSIKILYNQTNIPDFLASGDLFLYATPHQSNDSLPRALLEAHAAGLPIVVTATAGCPEIVEDLVSGFLVPYDSAAIAERAMELLDSPSKRQSMGKAGQQRIRELFNWNHMGESYALLFQQIISSDMKAGVGRADYR